MDHSMESIWTSSMESIWTYPWNPWWICLHSIWNPVESMWNSDGFHDVHGTMNWLWSQPTLIPWIPHGIPHGFHGFQVDSIWIIPGKVKTSEFQVPVFFSWRYQTKHKSGTSPQCLGNSPPATIGSKTERRHLEKRSEIFSEQVRMQIPSRNRQFSSTMVSSWTWGKLVFALCSYP